MVDKIAYHLDTSEETEVGLKVIATVDKSPAENGNATIVGTSGTTEVGDGGSSEAGEKSGVAGEVVEEEIVEFEFKKASPTLATYSMHCPSCKAEVVLRRQVITLRPPEPPAEPQPEVIITSETHGGASGPLDLDGYISSFRFFTGPSSSDDDIIDIVKFDGNTYKENERSHVEAEESSGVAGEDMEEEIVEFEFKKVKPMSATYSMHCPNCNSEVSTVVLRRKVFTLRPPEPPVKPKPGQVTTGGPPDLDEYILSLGLIAPCSAETAPSDIGEFAEVGRRRRWLGYDGILAEILKSIVYGSLMEVIASLSVVAFAAASNTSTLSIIALALASVIGGIIVISHNVWDLRDDCYKENTNEQTEGGAINKYKLVFGRMNYFPLHAFFAIASSLVLGMVPPVAYGFLFFKTNDRGFTMLAVAMVSLLCVGLLAIFKAKYGRLRYFKTLAYYIISTVLASGVCYVAGNLIMRLVKELGLFDTSSDGMPLVPRDTASYLASF